MSKQPPDLTALSYAIDSIGKLFSDSKTRHTWTFDVEGETQVVVVIASWNSSKFVVEVNGYERFHQVVSGVFVYSFKFQERYFKITARGENFVLLIDAIPFDAYTAKSKAAQAALLKSYATRPKVSSPHVVEEPEPFSGDLAKRLGKNPQDYIAQTDEEDFFAGSVEVHSFLAATVIPDLLHLGEEEDQPRRPSLNIESDSAVDPVASATIDPVINPVVIESNSPVTPRDQISASELANPFAAFDDLAKENPFA